MSVPIVYAPPGSIDTQNGAIRAPVSAGKLLRPSAALLNWLLQVCKQGLIFHGSWGASVTAMSTSIYHCRSVNCNHVLFVALVERSTYAQGGTLTFTPVSGSPITETFYDTSTPSSRFPGDSRGWAVYAVVAPVDHSGFFGHGLAWTNLVVRTAMLMELPSALLDYDDGDTIIESFYGSYAGLQAGRHLTDSPAAGVPALLSATEAARDGTRRHFHPLVVPDGSAWSHSSSGTWGNMMDGVFGTSNGYIPHEGRQIRAASTVVNYDARVRARYTGTGTGDLRIRSGTDSISFTSLTGSWAWHEPDSGALDIDAGTTDQVIVECQTTDGTTDVEVSSIQLVEHCPSGET